ncbi:hypothetical protein DI270_027745 [Microbispora triticiradicis]|uniref:Uncharacterized protein n=2 Tax=Microbispora triticiradicis TaxID=2200763 RepID=A0ABX9LDR5_9ACTN|nr:hypothetical protein DI270_027745 [Microbispora triticiradicis]
MAKDGASSDACRPRNHDVTGHDATGRDSTDQDVTRHEIARREATDQNVRGVPATLAPAAGVLSIADAAGSAAGQGHRSLPGRPVPDPAGVAAKPVLPALTAPRALPGTSSARALTGLVPRTGNAPAAGAAPVRVPGTAGGATTPAAAGVPAKSLPVGLATAPSAAKPISAGTSVLPSSTKPISLGTSGLPSATKPLAAGASALSSPARSLTAPAATVAGSRVPATAPVANSGTLLPARSAVPLLAVAPARPSASDAACPPQAPQGLRGEPAEQERVRPLTEGRPRARRHPRPEEEAGNAGGQSRAAHNTPAHNTAAHNPVAHNPAGQNPAGQGSAARPAEQAGLTPQSSTVSTSSQSGASGQEQTTETFPRKHPHRRHHPHKQDGTPEQAANQAGRPASAAQEDTGTATERKNGAGHRRQRDDAAAPAQAGRPQAAGQDRAAQGKAGQGKAAPGKAAQGRKIAPAVQPETVGGRRVPRLQPREYPRAAAHPQGGDITTPAALTRATGTHGVTDFAAATGNRILP